MEIKLSYLRGLREYQWELIRKIEDLRGQDWTFKEIADYLHSKGYTSSRGKPLSPPLVERMYKKNTGLVKSEIDRFVGNGQKDVSVVFIKNK